MEARNNNTIVIVPSYNEARTIGYIVRDLVDMDLSVLVVDDGSIDHTERIALDAGAVVMRHKENRGKGYSVRVGIKYVLEKTNFEWVVIMDGDGQHHTEDVRLLMEATRKNDYAMIIGDRMKATENMPKVRYWTNRFTSWVVSGLCRQHIPDTQCGFRLISRKALEKIELESDKYDIESEMLIQAADNKIRIGSVPVQTIYGDEISQIHPMRDTIKFFLLIIRYHLKSR